LQEAMMTSNSPVRKINGLICIFISQRFSR
jgi:hypothetical protein